jgi:antagonist of KipI
MSIRIIKPGISTTIQDSGRTGYRALGVPVSGAMDIDSFRLANILCGNEAGLPALEITLHGFECVFVEDCLAACCGDGSGVFINDELVPMGKAFIVRAGSLMSFRRSLHGCRAYLAVAGGFLAREDMGSFSTYVTASLGGHLGRPLRSGDHLYRNAEKTSRLSAAIMASIRSDGENFMTSKWGVTLFLYPEGRTSPIRIMKGPEWLLFNEKTREQLFQERFIVSGRSNRMGYRISGQLAGGTSGNEMVSTAVCPGTLQVTPDGTLVLLMADAQTTGGYPRIAQVAAIDLPRCAQLRPGQQVSFVPITIEEASEVLIRKERDIRMIREAIALKHSV